MVDELDILAITLKFGINNLHKKHTKFNGVIGENKFKQKAINDPSAYINMCVCNVVKKYTI